MPQNMTVTTPEPLGPISVPSTGDPRNSLDIRTIVQRLLNMIAGSLQVASPTGTVAAFAGAAAPSGWLLCNGQAISRTDYAALYSAIGTTFGPGNNSTTFNLPDLRGRSVVGVGLGGVNMSNRVRGETGGEEGHALTLQELPSHHHDSPTGTGTGTPVNYEVPPTGTGSATYDYAGSAPTSDAGGNGTHQNMPPYLVLNYIIRS